MRAYQAVGHCMTIEGGVATIALKLLGQSLSGLEMQKPFAGWRLISCGMNMGLDSYVSKKSIPLQFLDQQKSPSRTNVPQGQFFGGGGEIRTHGRG